jgi:hypothetical protein
LKESIATVSVAVVVKVGAPVDHVTEELGELLV